MVKRRQIKPIPTFWVSGIGSWVRGHDYINLTAMPRLGYCGDVGDARHDGALGAILPPRRNRAPMKTTSLWTRAVNLLMLPLVASPLGAQGQRADSMAKPPFESFSVIQYATTEGPGPQNILRLDNNGEIALAARSGMTREALPAQAPFTESQIALLKAFRLLEERNDTLKTAFPILDPEETRQLRGRVQVAAPRLAEQLAPDVQAFVQELRAIGREGNAYTMLFSYIIDGLVWDEFEESSLVDIREVTAANPFWAGEVWALYPPRAFAPGTNSISEEGVSLKVSWTEDAIPQMLPFVADVPTLIQMFDDYRTAGGVKHERVREVFGPFDLFDEEGRFTIPVIVEDDSNPMYRSAKAMAKAVAGVAPEHLHLTALVEEFKFRDAKQALVVAYHELMWELMDRLVAGGFVRKPTAFADPSRAEPADIADLVFIVRGSK